MNARFASVLLPFFILAALVGCSKPAPAKLRVSALTVNEFADLHGIKLNNAKTRKFEWPLGREHHLRAIVERSEDSGKTWALKYSIPYDRPVVRATVLFHLEQLPWDTKNPDGPTNVLLNLRLGGESVASSGWSGSRLLLPIPGPFYDSSSGPRADGVLVIGSQNIRYRLRLEAQERPGAKS